MLFRLPRGDFLYALPFLLFITQTLADVDPVVITGSRYFYKTNGTEFFIRGISYSAYKETTVRSAAPDDVLNDITSCRRDIPLLLELNINTIRVYYLDLAKDHTACLNAFADAGIYVIADLSSWTEYLDFDIGFWNTAMLDAYTNLLDSLAAFNNILAFSIGSYAAEYTNVLPFWKAAIRDLKSHMKQKNYREIPMGLSSYELPGVDYPTDVSYLTCDENHVDFIGIITLSEDPASISQDISTYAEQFRDSRIPVHVESSGSILPDDISQDNRTYEQVDTLYGKNVTQILSGGFISDYFQTFSPDDNFGLVNETDTGDVIPLPGFSALSSVMATAKPASTNVATYTPTTNIPACPTENPNDSKNDWNASSILPPTPYAKLCSCMMESLRCTAKTDELDTYDNHTLALEKRDAPCEGNAQNCVGIQAFGDKGQYGAFSSCNLTETFSWAANGYWQRHGDASCDLDGTVSLRPPTEPPSPECSFLLQQAGTNGENTITATAFSTATATATTTSKPHADKAFSTGAKAGIGLGAALFIIAILLGILLVLHRKKQAKKSAQLMHDDNPEFVPGTTMTDKSAWQYDGRQHDESRSHSRMSIASELPEGQGLMAEAPASTEAVPSLNTSPIEMPGDHRPVSFLGCIENGEGESQGHVHTSRSLSEVSQLSR